MKRNNINSKLSLFIASLLIIILSEGCKKGCTDLTATNYDDKAKKDNGSCLYDTDTTSATSTPTPQLKLKFTFDPNQERLDNLGNPATVASGHGAQTPTFNLMGAHYIELSKENDIPAYNGTQLYESPMTSDGGDEAIDFDQALYASDGEVFFTMDLDKIPAGTYKYLRISLSYQNYEIDYRAQGLDLKGTIASFVGANTYIKDYKIDSETVTVNANKLQGYWGFETSVLGTNYVTEGQSAGTTVPNPIASTSAIPPGSCLVTGIFSTPFTLTGDETSDIVINCSVSINQSFEWSDVADDNIYEPSAGDIVTDMGVRGLIPTVE